MVRPRMIESAMTVSNWRQRDRLLERRPGLAPPPHVLTSGRRQGWTEQTGPHKPRPAGQSPFEDLTYQYLPNLPNGLKDFYGESLFIEVSRVIG